MTFREAFAQAQKEYGHTEEQVAERMKHVNMVIPVTNDANLEATIEPGREREFIDSMVELRRKIHDAIQQDAEGFLKMYKEKMSQRASQN